MTKDSVSTRRSFLKGAGLATGAAIIGASPIAASAASEEAAELVASPSALPKEPLVAYVRDASKGEVTVVSGLHETTFKDHALVRRIAKAAARHPQQGEVL